MSSDSRVRVGFSLACLLSVARSAQHSDRDAKVSALGAISCLFGACDGDEQGRRQVGDSPF